MSMAQEKDKEFEVVCACGCACEGPLMEVLNSLRLTDWSGGEYHQLITGLIQMLEKHGKKGEAELTEASEDKFDCFN